MVAVLLGCLENLVPQIAQDFVLVLQLVENGSTAVHICEFQPLLSAGPETDLLTSIHSLAPCTTWSNDARRLAAIPKIMQVWKAEHGYETVS